MFLIDHKRYFLCNCWRGSNCWQLAVKCFNSCFFELCVYTLRTHNAIAWKIYSILVRLLQCYFNIESTVNTDAITCVIGQAYEVRRTVSCVTLWFRTPEIFNWNNYDSICLRAGSSALQGKLKKLSVWKRNETDRDSDAEKTPSLASRWRRKSYAAACRKSQSLDHLYEQMLMESARDRHDDQFRADQVEGDAAVRYTMCSRMLEKILCFRTVASHS